MNSPKLINHSKTIQGLYEIELDSFKDERGQNFEYFELGFRYNNNFAFIHEELNIDFRQALLSASISKKNVIRGGHGQKEGHKLVFCPLGDIQFFVADINPLSNTYKNTIEFNLTPEKQRMFILPPYTLNFHGCLSESCIFQYFWQEGYVEQDLQLHGKWNEFNLPWKIENPILSHRDK